MTISPGLSWGKKFHPAPWNISRYLTASFSAGRPMKAIGILTYSIVIGLLVGLPAYAQEKCSAQVIAILNDPEANKPPQYSGTWEAYECTSCKGVREDLQEYKFEIEHEKGNITLTRDLHDLTFGPGQLKGRNFSARDSVVTLNIEFSEGGTEFEGTITYSTRHPGTLMVFGKLSDEEVSAKRRQLAEKRRGLSNRAANLSLQCLKKFEEMNVVEKSARITQLEAQLVTAQAQLKSTQDKLKQADTLSGARDQILQVYADGMLKGGQRAEACTLFRAMVIMNPAKAGLIGQHGC